MLKLFKDTFKCLRSVFSRGGLGKRYLLLRGNNSVDDCSVAVPLGDALNPNLLPLPPSLPLDSHLKFLLKKAQLL